MTASAMTEDAMTAEQMRYVALHTLGAAAFFFVLNLYVLGTALEHSVLWAVGFGAMAGFLAWQHMKR
jgi:hypothetical protein